MSLWQDDPPPAWGTLTALAVLSLVAVGSLSRVISGPGYLAYAIPALVVGSAFAFVFGRRSLGLGFLFLLAAWALTLPVLFVRDKTKYGLPSGESFRAIRKLVASGLQHAPTSTPPVDGQPRYLILVWTAFLFLGFLGASWVVVRRPVGAIISALGIVTFAGSLGDGSGRTWFALAAVAATGAFFLAEGRQRIGGWTASGVRLPTWFGVPTLGAACAVAVAAPFIIGDQPLVQLRGAIRPRLVIIKPLSDIKRQLKVDPPIEVMRVGAPRPTYWRLTSLDHYDGREWVLEAKPNEVRRGIVPAPNPPTTGEVIEQRYTLTSLLAPWMPAAYAARTVDSGATVEVDSGSQTLLLRGATTPGLAYVVRSQLPHVTINAPAPKRDVSDPNEKAMGSIAQQIVGGARTPLEAARRLEKHFRAYTYNEDVAGGHSIKRLQRFLAERKGYCEQFAATMTLMLRGLGIPARVGVGFLPGVQTAGEYVVSTRDAHAWVEVNIPGAGWTAFDPTPGRGNTSQIPPKAEEAAKGTPPPIPQTSAAPAPTPEQEPLPTGQTQPVSAGLPGAVLWTALALALVAVVPTAKRLRRAVRSSGPPVEVVLGAYAELSDTARDLGWKAAPSETHREFLTRTIGRVHPAADAVASLAGRALYGKPGEATSEDGTQAWTAFGPAARAVRDRAPWWRRAWAIFDPRTFIPEPVWSCLRSLRRVLKFAPAR